MRSFKKYIAEVAQPREKGAHEEQAFKDQHVYEVVPHPVALDTQFTGDIQQATRPADQKGDAAYDQAYSKGVFEESAEEAVSEALSPKQKELDHDKDGDIDGKDLAALRAKKKKKTEEVEADLEEKVKHSDKHIKMAIGIASDKRYKGGNMTGAVKAMNKMKPGISDHPQVAAVLKRQNEEFVALEEDMNKVHTVDIDHTGEHDSAAKKHNITIKKSKGTADSHSATGKKKDLQKYLAHHYDSAEDAKDIHPEVHETTMSAVKKPVTMTGPDGKTRTVMKTTKVKNTDDYGQDKIKTNESIIQELEENIKFKVGMLRLKNGKSVVLKKQDSDLLTQMFKDLSPTNRRKLGAVAMKDEAGFKEILGFAREAL
jgi:hypothetical protein